MCAASGVRHSVRDMSLEVRTITESEFPDWLRALNTGFLRPPVSSDKVMAGRRASSDLTRAYGAFDQGRCVATFRSFPQELTVVGGATSPVNAISNVTVSPTHRRRGLLSRMMATDLAAAKERGDVAVHADRGGVSDLRPVRLRPGRLDHRVDVDVLRTGLDPRWSGPHDGGRIDLDRRRGGTEDRPGVPRPLPGAQPGAIDRTERWWRVRPARTP